MAFQPGKQAMCLEGKRIQMAASARASETNTRISLDSSPRNKTKHILIFFCPIFFSWQVCVVGPACLFFYQKWDHTG